MNLARQPRHRGWEVIDRYGYTAMYPARRQARRVARQVQHAKVRGPWRQAWEGRRDDFHRYRALFERAEQV